MNVSVLCVGILGQYRIQGVGELLSMPQEYYSVLARSIAAAGEDHSQLRGVIYQLARVELKTELARRHEAEMQEQVSALENAIKKIETDIIENPALLTFTPGRVVDENSHEGSQEAQPSRQSSREVIRPEVLPPIDARRPFEAEHSWPRPALSEVGGSLAARQPDNQIRATFWWNLQVVVATLLGVAIYAVGESRGDVVGLITGRGGAEASIGRQMADGHSGQKVAALVATPTTGSITRPPATIGGAPLPTAYGVYAVDQGKLTDLATLPIKVPDPRVAISAMIATPSPSSLPDGKVQFVAFRRDFKNNAPDRVTVRVVARVMQTLNFDTKGKANTAKVEGEWAVRSNAYQMRVAPMGDNPEMIVIEPENPDFSFPPGRYAMVLQGAAYDFSVAGPITDMAQCLERTDAVDVPVYSECRNN
jgi:hypothetical protein